MAVPTIAAAVLHKVLANSVKVGVDGAALLAELEIPSSILDEPDARVPIAKVHVAWERLLARVPDVPNPHFMGVELTPGEYGLFGFVVMTSATTHATPAARGIRDLVSRAPQRDPRVPRAKLRTRLPDSARGGRVPAWLLGAEHVPSRVQTLDASDTGAVAPRLGSAGRQSRIAARHASFGSATPTTASRPALTDAQPSVPNGAMPRAYHELLLSARVQTLTTTDAFFVAYQERAGISMHLGAELELAGTLDREMLDAAIAHVLARWPALASTLAKKLGGLTWTGQSPVLTVTDSADRVEAWRNTHIDPFREPPFGVLWVPRGDRHHLAVRCHHAVADGMLFLAIVGELLANLGAPSTASAAGSPDHPLSFGRVWREVKLADSWKHARTLSREAKLDRSARVALREAKPGAIATCDRRIDAATRRAITARAASAQVRPPWIVAAAWLRAVYAWNARRDATQSLMSLEVPVSLRRGPHAMDGTGNHLTVLTLFADARASVDELARALWDDYVAGIRRRDHLAISLFGAPVRLLPWSMFRRVAVTTTSTGFATTHFTWVEHERDFRSALRDRTNGALVVRDQRFYTPVCLRMGVALGVMAWPDSELQLSITHRLTGMTSAEADELCDLLVEELA